MGKMRLTEEAMDTYAMAKVFKACDNDVNSMDWYRTGEHLIYASDDDSVHLVDGLSGEHKKVLYVKKHGCRNLAFTHNSDSVVHSAGRPLDYTIRYWSIRTNQYLKYFKAHSDVVTSVAMHPTSDLVLSSSLDSTVRLWDLRSTTCQALCHVEGSATCQFDPTGATFAATTTQNEMYMFDVRKCDAGPFLSAYITSPSPAPQVWSQLRFSPNGCHLAVSSTPRGNVPCYVTLIDAFDTANQVTIQPTRNNRLSPAIDFTADSAYLLVGTETGTTLGYSIDKATDAESRYHDNQGNLESGYHGNQVDLFPMVTLGETEFIARRESATRNALFRHAGAVTVVRASPKHVTIATASANVSLWQPNPEVPIAMATDDPTTTASASEGESSGYHGNGLPESSGSHGNGDGSEGSYHGNANLSASGSEAEASSGSFGLPTPPSSPFA